MNNKEILTLNIGEQFQVTEVKRGIILRDNSIVHNVSLPLITMISNRLEEFRTGSDFIKRLEIFSDTSKLIEEGILEPKKAILFGKVNLTNLFSGINGFNIINPEFKEFMESLKIVTTDRMNINSFPNEELLHKGEIKFVSKLPKTAKDINIKFELS